MAGRASTPVKKVFGVPYMGINNAVPEHAIDPSSLWAAYNCAFIRGRVATRKSMVPLSAVGGGISDPAMGSRPLGCWSAWESNGVFDVFANDHTKLWRLRSLTGSWTDVSGAITLTNGDTHTPRYASLYNQATGDTATAMVNGVDDPVVSLNGANFAVGTLPGGDKPIDLATVASRFMAIIPPYRVRWSDIYSATFPALTFYTAQDTTGKVVAVRNLGALGACIYKEDAIVVAYSQPGSPANAFRFETRLEVPGPAGPSAVVQAEGKHFFMTATGRIGVFDGTRFEWVGDGAWNFLLEDFDYARRYQTHGFYDDGFGQVWFVYPRLSEAGAGPTGIAIVSLPRPAWGVSSYGVWIGAFAVPCSCSNTIHITGGSVGMVLRSDVNRNAMIITNPYPYNTYGDAGNTFVCLIQTGLQGLQDIIKADLEPFLERGAGFGTCTVSPVISYSLGTTGGFVAGTPQSVNLEDPEPVHSILGYQAAGRFMGIRIDWISRVPATPAIPAGIGGQVIYKGGVIYGHSLETP